MRADMCKNKKCCGCALVKVISGHFAHPFSDYKVLHVFSACLVVSWGNAARGCFSRRGSQIRHNTGTACILFSVCPSPFVPLISRKWKRGKPTCFRHIRFKVRWSVGCFTSLLEFSLATFAPLLNLYTRAECKVSNQISFTCTAPLSPLSLCTFHVELT